MWLQATSLCSKKQFGLCYLYLKWQLQYLVCGGSRHCWRQPEEVGMLSSKEVTYLHRATGPMLTAYAKTLRAERSLWEDNNSNLCSFCCIIIPPVCIYVCVLRHRGRFGVWTPDNICMFSSVKFGFARYMYTFMWLWIHVCVNMWVDVNVRLNWCMLVNVFVCIWQSLLVCVCVYCCGGGKATHC